MKNSKFRLALIAVLSILTVVFTSVGLIGCGGKSTFGFNDNMKDSYVINEIINLEDAVDFPANNRPRLTATYVKDGVTRKYLVAGLTFKPTNTGEVTITLTLNDKSITKDILITEPKPILIDVPTLTREKGDTIELSALESSIQIVPDSCKAKISKYRFAGGEEKAIEQGATTFTFDSVGEYQFYFVAENISGQVDGWLTVNVTRQMTENEVDDLSNSIKQWGYSTVEQVDEHSVGSDWAWKVSAIKTGTYADGKNMQYWQSRVYIDFGEFIDLSRQYVEFDVLLSENVENSIGAHVYFATSQTTELGWHLNLGGSVNEWSTVSSSDERVKTGSGNFDNKTPVRGMFISVLHKQSGVYNPEEVYMIIDNVVVLSYPEIGPNEQNDYTNKGASEKSVGTNMRMYTEDYIEGSDWSWKVSTKSESKASDYPYVDIPFGEQYSLSDYGFSFFVKGNAAYDNNQFIFALLDKDENNAYVFNGGYYYAKLQENEWNYIQSSDYSFSRNTFVALRIMLNTATMSAKDAELLIDQLILVSSADMQKEKLDASNSISVSKGNNVSFVMSDDVNGNSAWAWKIKGYHFDFFKVSFDKSYAFSNNYFSMDVKPVSNFGGMIIAQFVASDGSIKKDFMFDGNELKNATDYVNVNTANDSGTLLASYAAVNLYIIAKDASKPVEVLVDNVGIKSLDNTEYVAVDADDWEISTSGDKTTVKLISYAGGSKYIEYAKEGGYTNQLITVRTMLNGGDEPYLAIAARVPSVINWAGNGPYNYPGFYLKFNKNFYTLYGPVFNGTHCGSFNPSGIKVNTEYDITFGVIAKDDSMVAVLYIEDLEGNLVHKREWHTYPELKYQDNVVIPSELSGSFVVYSIGGTTVNTFDKEHTITVTKPFDVNAKYMPAPKLIVQDNKITIDAAYADSFVLSVNDGAFEPLNKNEIVFDEYGTYNVKVKNVIGGVVGESTATATIDTAIVVMNTDENSVSWSNLLADSYLVKVNDGEFTSTTNTSISFTEFKSYTVAVKAVANGIQSAEYSKVLDLSKPIVETGKTLVSYYNPLAVKYLISIDGAQAFETTETTYEFTQAGIFSVSIIAIDANGNQSAAAETTVVNNDQISLKNMTGITYNTLSTQSGDITFTPVKELLNDRRSAATIVLKGGYGAGDYIKVGFTAVDQKIYNNKIGVSFGSNVDNADLLGSLYSINMFSFGSIMTLVKGGDAPINYDTTWSNTSPGNAWHGANSAITNLTVGEKYYIVLGVTGTGENAVIDTMVLDKDGAIIRATSWSISALIAADARNTVLPESYNIAIHRWLEGEQTITYEITTRGEVITNEYNKAPTLTTNGTTVSWSSPLAEEYAVSINGGDFNKTNDLSTTLTEYGIYTISVKAIYNGQESPVATTSIVYLEDDISLKNMSGIEIGQTFNYEQGEITFTPRQETTDRNAATMVLKGGYGAGDYIKVGFIATDAKIYNNGISISFGSNADSADRLGSLYSLMFYSFGSIMTLTKGGNTPINYDNTYSGTEVQKPGVAWYGNNTVTSNLTVGKQYYIVLGVTGTGENAVIDTMVLDESGAIIRATMWKMSTLMATNTNNVVLPTSYNIAIHSWATGEQTITYEFTTRGEVITNDYNVAPTLITDGATVSWSSPLAEEYAVSINGGDYNKTSDLSKTFTEYGIYTVGVKAIYNGQESPAATTTVIYLEDDIKLYNMTNVVVNGAAPTYEKGDLSFTFEYEDAYRHNSVARSSSAIVLNKPYTTGEFIKVGFTATTNSIKDACIGIGILGTTTRPYDSYAPGRHTLDTTKDGAGLLLGWSENAATEYLGTAGFSSETHASKISLTSGLSVGSKYYIAVGVESTQTDKVLTVALLDGAGNVLNLYTLSQAAAQARNSAFGAFPDSGHFAILYFGEENTSTSIDYEIINRNAIYNKVVVAGASSYTISEANGVSTINYTANSNVSETGNWREGYGVSISTLTKYTNEFVKVGFTPVQCRTDTTDGAKTGLTLDDQRITIQYRAATIKSEAHPAETFQTLFYNNGVTNVQVSSSINGDGTYRAVNLGNLDTTKHYYIIAGVVTTQTESTFYYVLTVENGTEEQVLFSTSWVLGSTAPNKTLADSGYLVVNCATPNQTELTYQILTEEQGLAIVNG